MLFRLTIPIAEATFAKCAHKNAAICENLNPVMLVFIGKLSLSIII